VTHTLAMPMIPYPFSQALQVPPAYSVISHISLLKLRMSLLW
jgi:hypothetical protein